MKNYIFLAAVMFCAAAIYADNFGWSLLWSGSWAENTQEVSEDPALAGDLNNRAEIKLLFYPPGLALRGQALDKRAFDFSLKPPLEDSKKQATNFTGGLYHKPTGSRFLYGALDEWGLPARIRNPWIRSPPYVENHKPIIADSITTVSGTKEDEAYLYLSTPVFKIATNTKLRGFICAQTEIKEFTPALSGGLDLSFGKGKGSNLPYSLLLETFYTGKTLPQSKQSSWFSESPALPEREFSVYAAAAIFTSPDFSVSSDFAVSETFAVGRDFYANMGVSITPLLPFGRKARPLLIALAADGAGGQFVYRDGLDHGEGLRTAAKIEWKGNYNSLLRLNLVLRSPSFGENISRGSAQFYWRLPASAGSLFKGSTGNNVNGSAVNKNNIFRLTRISLSADRNAANRSKVSDGFSGTVGMSFSMAKAGIKNPLNLSISASVDGITDLNNEERSWNWEKIGANCEIYWSILRFQLRSKVGVAFYAEKDEKWDLSLSGTIRFKYGRLGLKAASPDFPEKWNWTISWRVEKNEKK
ncbi:MAG: hypothetical protein FWB95_01560 [Treponema sp.]|nr:hypothetical protein [Treponema sp.]